jgi:hypothetical protein
MYGRRLLLLNAQARPQAQLAGLAPFQKQLKAAYADFNCPAKPEGCAGGRKASDPRMKAAGGRHVRPQAASAWRARPTVNEVNRACAVLKAKKDREARFLCP